MPLICTKEKFLELSGHEPTTLDELAECIKTIINGTQLRPWGSSKRKNTPPVNHRVLGLCWDLKFSDHVSNSHSAPLQGVQNFRGNIHLPRGYHGFVGRIWLRLAEDPNGFGNEILKNTLTYPGSGGGGAYNGIWREIEAAYWKRYHYSQPTDRPYLYSWDYKIFLDDFPEIAKLIRPALSQYEKERNWHILKSPRTPFRPFQLEHTYQWTDPETQKDDEEFLRLVNE